MTTVLVTGAAGFVARHLLTALRAHGVERVVGADLRAAPQPGFDVWQSVDLTDALLARRLVAAELPATVFHLAGQMHAPDLQVRSSNVESARAVLDAVRAEAPAARIVLMGSAAEYGEVPADDQPVRESFAGNPPSAYGKAKREVTFLAERYSRDHALRVCVARPSNVIGAGVPDVLVVGAIVSRIRAALAGPPPRALDIGATGAVRDFVSASDVAEGLIRIADRGGAGEAYNLCTGEGHTVTAILQRLLALAPEPVSVRHEAALLRPGEVSVMVCSPEKAKCQLGWRPVVSLDESLREAWESSAAGGPS